MNTTAQNVEGFDGIGALIDNINATFKDFGTRSEDNPPQVEDIASLAQKCTTVWAASIVPLLMAAGSAENAREVMSLAIAACLEEAQQQMRDFMQEYMGGNAAPPSSLN